MKGYFYGGTFAERKAARKEYFENYIKGWKLVKCLACNGSGYYDNNGSPRCSSCDGTGKDRVSPKEYARYKGMGL